MASEKINRNCTSTSNATSAALKNPLKYDLKNPFILVFFLLCLKYSPLILDRENVLLSIFDPDTRQGALVTGKRYIYLSGFVVQCSYIFNR